MAKNQHHEIDISPFDVCMQIQDPQMMLSKAFQDRNLHQFKIALDSDADPTRIDDQTRISLFEKILQTYGSSEFVEECLRRGCKCDYTNRLIGKTPLSFAADSRDPKIIECVLRQKGISLDTKYSNLTPLNSLAKGLTDENFDNVFECIKLLLKYGANPNIPDQREMTPILYILNNRKIDNDRKKEIVKYFLENSEIDLDTFRDGEARERIIAQFPDLQLQLPNEIDSNISFEALISFLRNGNEEKFLEKFNEYQMNLSEKDNQQNSIQENNSNLLIEAIKSCLNDAVEAIIRAGANVNLTAKMKSPIEIACIYGNWKALQLILEQDDLKLRQHENLLITVIKKLDEPTYNTSCNYYNCFYTLVESEKIDINEVDRSGSTPLHYAVKYKNERAIRELLKRGAYIGAKSHFNDLPITDINPDLLEDFFDSCISTNSLKPGDDNFEITINYTNLIPTPCANKMNLGSPYINEEMRPIEHMANSKELRHLLKHPLITSFLFLKWHRLSIIFYLNFILYSIFWISLVTYIMLHYNQTADESVIVTFKCLAFFGLIYMVVREAFQFLISPIMFMRSKINLLEIILIILSVITLCEPNYQKETQRVFAVFTILLASAELYLLVGSLPIISISTHMRMLQEVSTTFLKSFTLYSIFVITFSLCFYILFGRADDVDADLNDKKPKDQNNNDDNDGEFNKFINPFTAIIKTIVMLTGEFDAGDIDFRRSFISYLIFLLFVFFMTIVLFNLLNGLAVSDTQAIKSQAELNGCICRTKLLSSYESVLTGRNATTGMFINHQPFRSICKRLTNLFPNYISGNEISILPNDSNKILIPVSNSRETELGYVKKNGNTFLNSSRNEYDREKKILYSNYSLLPCCCLCFSCNCSRMDMKTVKNAFAVLEKNQIKEKDKQKNADNENRLRKIDEKIDKIFELLQRVVAK